MDNAQKVWCLLVLMCVPVLVVGCPIDPDHPNGNGDPPVLAGVSWARRAGGLTGDAAYSVARNADGSSIVTGYFSGTAEFPSPQGVQEAWTAAGGTDMFVAKYAQTGQLSWVRAAGGVLDDEGRAVAVLPDGSFYVAGSYSYPFAVFGAGESGHQVLFSGGGRDVFLAHYNSDGTFRRVARAGGATADEANDLAVFSDGSAVITGYFTDLATFGLGEAGQAVLTAAGAQDLFVARYNDDGTLDWAHRAGGPYTDVGTSIAAYPDGSCVVVGYLGARFKHAGDGMAKNLERAIYLARFNDGGRRLWLHEIAGTGDAAAQGVAALPNGDCVVVGGFTGTLIFGQGEARETTLSAGNTQDAFFVRLDDEGELVWARQAGSTTGDTQAYAVSAFADGTFAAGGYFTRSLVLGRGEPNETTLTAKGGQDMFAATFTADGSVEQVFHGGGTNDQAILGIACAPDGNFLAAGAFRGMMTLGLDSSASQRLTSAGEWDIFVARISE